MRGLHARRGAGREGRRRRGVRGDRPPRWRFGRRVRRPSALARGRGRVRIRAPVRRPRRDPRSGDARARAARGRARPRPGRRPGRRWRPDLGYRRRRQGRPALGAGDRRPGRRLCLVSRLDRRQRSDHVRFARDDRRWDRDQAAGRADAAARAAVGRRHGRGRRGRGRRRDGVAAGTLEARRRGRRRRRCGGAAQRKGHAGTRRPDRDRAVGRQRRCRPAGGDRSTQ